MSEGDQVTISSTGSGNLSTVSAVNQQTIGQVLNTTSGASGEIFPVYLIIDK